jgi:hypothetical protein
MAEDTLPNFTPETDPAEAFEEVRRELSMLENAIKGLTAEREKAPDYTATLGDISEWLKAINQRLYNVEHSRVLSLSPVELVKEINTAAHAARSEDRQILAEAHKALSRSLGEVDLMIARGRSVAGRARRERWIAAGGMLAGILLWSILPGAAMRSLPASWHAPEWMAARMMGVEAEVAGGRLIETANRADGQ